MPTLYKKYNVEVEVRVCGVLKRQLFESCNEMSGSFIMMRRPSTPGRFTASNFTFAVINSPAPPQSNNGAWDSFETGYHTNKKQDNHNNLIVIVPLAAAVARSGLWL